MRRLPARGSQKPSPSSCRRKAADMSSVASNGGVPERGPSTRRAESNWDGKPRGGYPMNILLWVLQVIAALLYGSSGVMKVFMFDEVSVGVQSFGALPRDAWMALGIIELVCTFGLIVPAALRWRPRLTVVAAA